ncbi:MAG: hypothetical protein COU40_00780 [Candidatus Moranbacteria bacterium CG10_big_fil_rev_8_21_14_0_10_35_21]|nr:MAG: hypothetical protein COU40_00780 [Candidatus Moranbacteria bacterium CG10_big_fil_rev_8_21_14_0_10_35_21]PJA88279.1 MAG: hypothetical protein CO139_03960 [Candidatus Moranbacteria bacterium CG_4_9_14_3_um_filter_36_9]
MADEKLDIKEEEISEEELPFYLEEDWVTARGICFDCGGLLTKEVNITAEEDDSISFNDPFCMMCDTWIESKLSRYNN